MQPVDDQVREGKKIGQIQNNVKEEGDRHPRTIQHWECKKVRCCGVRNESILPDVNAKRQNRVFVVMTTPNRPTAE